MWFRDGFEKRACLGSGSVVPLRGALARILERAFASSRIWCSNTTLYGTPIQKSRLSTPVAVVRESEL